MRTKRKVNFTRRIAVVLLLLAVLGVACVAAPQQGAGPLPAAEEGDAEGEETATSVVEPVSIAYASDLDPADVADLLGLDCFREQYDVEIVELTQDSAVVAGLLRGDVDIGNAGIPDVIKAYAAGVETLRVFMPANMVFEFVLIGQPGIETVQDLRGQTVAYHAPGSGTEILPRLLVDQAEGITQEEVEWTVLPESPNRAAAMQANRIDVTALEFADVLTLREEGGKDFPIIASFADVAPEAISSTWVTSEGYAADHPEVVEALATCLAQGYALAYEDKSAWMAKATETLPDVPEARLSETYDFYAEIGMFPRAPYYTEERWDAMNDFFVSAGEYEDPAPWDLVLVDAVEAATQGQEQ